MLGWSKQFWQVNFDEIGGRIIEPDKGSRFLQPGQTTRYLSQEPDLSSFTTRDYVADGLPPCDEGWTGRLALNALA